MFDKIRKSYKVICNSLLIFDSKFPFVTKMLRLYEFSCTKRRNPFFNGILILRGKGKMKKFKRSKYPQLKKHLPPVLIGILILFLAIFFFTSTTARSNFVVVSGIAWEDLNENGKQDNNEPVLKDIDVYLCDTNGNVMRNTSTGEEVKTKTDENGYYQFDANLGARDKYAIKFAYEGLEYKFVEIVKQNLSYDINSFLNKVNVVWNFPKTSEGRERIFQARLNQFNMNNKNEVVLQYDSNTLYKDNRSLNDGNIISVDMNEVGSLNLVNQKTIFFIYFDASTTPPAKEALLNKLKQIQNSIDDNEYKIILCFTGDFADEAFKNEVKETQSTRIKVVENEQEFERALVEYLAGRAKEEAENPFGKEDESKRSWLTNTYPSLAASERQAYRQNGGTKITALSFPLEADGKLVYISLGLKREPYTEENRNENDVPANDNGDKLVVGSVLWDDGSRVTNAPIKVELFQQIQTQEEYDQRVAQGAYGEINANSSEGYYGKILIGNPRESKVVNDDGTYAIAYPGMGRYMVRFTYGHNGATQGQDINGEKCMVPEGAVGVTRNQDSGQNNASENLERRNAINNFFESDEDGDGHRGVNNYKTRLSQRKLDMNELIQKTQMIATTDWFDIYWYIDTDEEEPDESEPPPKMYANLMLKRREQADFKVSNEVEALKLTLADGRIEKEMTKERNQSLLQLNPVYMQLDDEYLHGATLKIQYLITIKNTGELPITSMRIMDYLDHEYGNLHYSPDDTMITENKKNRDYGWNLLTDFHIDEGANDHNFENPMQKDRIYLQYLQTTTLNPGEEVTLRLVGSVVINKRDATYNYANAVEVVSYTNPKGRVHENSTQRNSVFTVGNIKPTEETSNMTEGDQAFAHEVLITNPTGVRDKK